MSNLQVFAIFEEETMIKRVFALFVLFLLVACSTDVTSTPGTSITDITLDVSTTLPPRPIPIPSPTLSGVPNDDTSLYILLDASYSSMSFQKTRNQIAGFFYTLATRYLGISPQVYSFGGQKNGVLTKIDGYSDIQELKSSSNLGDFYSEAIQKGWKYLQNETKPRRFLIILVEGSFYSDQEKEKLKKEVDGENGIATNLREADSIYFLVINHSQLEWWKNNLDSRIKPIHVLDASDSMREESIKEVTREIFGEKIQWLPPGKWEPVSFAKFSRQQLSAVLLNPKNTIEVELVGGGLEPLSGGWDEENFRQSTFESNSPARLQLKSPSGLAAYWTTDINPFQIEHLSIDRSIDRINCPPAKKCLEIKVTFSLNPASSVTSNKAILSAKNGNFNSDEIHTLGGGEYYVNFRWESENEPENIQFSVEHGESIVFGPVNVVPYPIIVSARARDETRKFPSGDSEVYKEYRILEIEFWFLSQQEPVQVKGDGCNIQENTPKEAPASHWERDANTLKIYLLKEELCQSFSIIFQSEPMSITCDISDNKSLKCREQEERRKQ
jgi:hypothetical protein